jgi:hypothetical protein
VPPRGRWLVAGLAVLVLLGGGVLLLRYWSAERALRQEVGLATALGVWSSSTSPPGGEVGFFLLVRNDGTLPVSVTSVEAADRGVQLRMRDDVERIVAPGREIDIPLSVRVTCVAGAAAARSVLGAELGLRLEDGTATSRRVDPERASVVLDVAATVCEVRPGLRDHELSGPVLRVPTDR